MEPLSRMFVLGMVFVASMIAVVDSIEYVPLIEIELPTWVYVVVCLIAFALAVATEVRTVCRRRNL